MQRLDPPSLILLDHRSQHHCCCSNVWLLRCCPSFEVLEPQQVSGPMTMQNMILFQQPITIGDDVEDFGKKAHLFFYFLFLFSFCTMTNDDKTLANVFFVVVGVSHVILISFGGHVGAFFSLSLSLFLVSGVLCSLSRAHHLLDTCNKQATLPESCDTNVTSRHLRKVLCRCARALFPHRF